MKFCPECGSRLVLKEKGKAVLLACPSCSYVERPSEGLHVLKREVGKPPIVVVGEVEGRLKTTPSSKVECPKCGNKEATWWMAQIRGADESATQFFRCTSCGYTWRESS
jgi:DNA-directed RNA polymerase subunit M